MLEYPMDSETTVSVSVLIIQYIARCVIFGWPVNQLKALQHLAAAPYCAMAFAGSIQDRLRGRDEVKRYRGYPVNVSGHVEKLQDPSRKAEKAHFCS